MRYPLYPRRKRTILPGEERARTLAKATVAVAASFGLFFLMAPLRVDLGYGSCLPPNKNELALGLLGGFGMLLAGLFALLGGLRRWQAPLPRGLELEVEQATRSLVLRGFLIGGAIPVFIALGSALPGAARPACLVNILWILGVAGLALLTAGLALARARRTQA